METKRVRVQFNGETAEFPLPKTFDDFIKLSLMKLNLQNVNLDTLNINYKDEDDDTVVITSPYDYDQALKFFKTINDDTLEFMFEQKSISSCPSDFNESVRSGMVFDNKSISQKTEDDKLKEEMDKMAKIIEREQEEREKNRLEYERKEKEKLEEQKRRIRIESIEQQLKEKELLEQQIRSKEEENLKQKKLEKEVEKKEKLEKMALKLNQLSIQENKKKAFNEFKLNVERKKRLIRLIEYVRKNELIKCFNTFKSLQKKIKVIEPPVQGNNENEGQMMSQYGTDDQETRERLERKNRIMQKIQEKAHEEVARSRVMTETNEYKSALNQIKDECSNDISKKMSQYIDAQYQRMKEELIESTLKLNNNMIQTYIAKIGQVENERQSQFQVEMSKVSQSIMVSKTYTGVHNFPCNQCYRNPIVGIRYQCSECNDYNLCENCEENNYTTKVHPHDFVRIRDQRKGMKQRQNEKLKGKYSYECLTKEKKFIYKKGSSIDNEFKCTLILKNNYGSTWNESKLVCDKLKSSIVCPDIVLPKLAPDQSSAVLCKFNNIEVCKEGNYNCVLKFNVDGIDYGEPLVFTIKVEEITQNLKSLIHTFRQKFDLLSHDLSDYAILQALEKTNNNLQKAFEQIFS